MRTIPFQKSGVDVRTRAAIVVASRKYSRVKKKATSNTLRTSFHWSINATSGAGWVRKSRWLLTRHWHPATTKVT